MSLFQPVGQKRLTNVAVVRYKKHGKRFEIACYKNKVLNWRNGIEKDLDEVLQSTTVYTNVSKAILASREDLKLVFGTDDEESVCKFILAQGDLQVSDRERKVDLDTKFRDVAAVISEKCINPTNSRPYTIPMIERALKDIHFSVDPNRPAKIQALESVPLLQARFPIERASMRLRLTFPMSSRDEIDALLTGDKATIEESEIMDPGLFRPLHSVLSAAGGKLEIVELAAHATTAAGSADGAHPSTGETETQARFSQLGLDAARRGSPGHELPVSSRTDAAQAESGHRASTGVRTPSAPVAEQLVYRRGPISGLPDEFASRRDRFAELDDLEPGWTIELISKGDSGTVDAVFFAPDGTRVGAYVVARRQALWRSKARA